MKAKKMIVPILMGVLMAFAILPMTAGKAYAEDYGLWVGGTRVKSDNALNIPGLDKGMASYNATSKTLMLDNAEIKGVYASSNIYSTIPDLTIEVNGENKLSGGDYGIRSINNNNNDFTITGDGSLQAKGSVNGIVSDGGVTIKDATVTATGTDIAGIGIEAGGEIKIEGRSTVQAQGKTSAILSHKKITLGGHAITEPAKGRVSDDGSYIVDQNGQQATSVTIERVVEMSGDGTEDSPYEITKYADLQEFAAIVNGTHDKASQDTDVYGELMNDIDCGNDQEWVPIGNHDNKYTGHFDGNNKVIKGLSSISRADYQGLFGYIGSGGEVKNVGLEGGMIKGASFVGGVAGWNEGTIMNCYNGGEVRGAGTLGGMVGCNNGGTISSCYNTGAISAGPHTGGLVGYNSGGTITNCYNTGAVSGSAGVSGLVGKQRIGEIINCYNSGAVNGRSKVGGVVGNTEDNYGTITNCYYDRAFNMFTKAVGDTGDTGNVKNVKGLTTSQMTGETALADSNMFFSYNPGEENPWIVKANGIDPKSGDYYLYYPHLKGFAYDSSTSAADWPAKAIVNADIPDSFTYNGAAQGLNKITVSQKPVEVPEGKTAEYSMRTDKGWEVLPTAPTDPGCYKMTIKDGGKVIEEIVFVILQNTDYTVNYYEQTGGNSAEWSNGVEPIAAGTYKAVVTLTDGAVLEEKEFQIKPAPLTIKAKDQTLTYNGQTQGPGDAAYEDPAEIAEKVTVKGLQGSDKLTKIEVDGQGKEVGEYDLVPNGAAVGNATDNYDITYVNGKLTITKAKPKPKPQPKPQPKINKAAAKIALDAGVIAKSSGSKVTASWGKVKGASSYVIYANYCDQKKLKKIRTVSGKTTSFDITKLNGKKFDPKKNLKFYVVAYKTVKGKKVKLAKSIMAHAPGSKNTKRTNVTGVKVKKASFTLKKGKTAKIKAKLVLQKKSKKPLKHCAKFRYASSNKKVAKVSKKGKITAVGKGKCTVYVYAVSGVSKKIKVTVK